MAATVLALAGDTVAVPRRPGPALTAHLLTADGHSLLHDLTASWLPESTVINRRDSHRIPCEIVGALLPIDDQEQIIRVDPLAVLIANLSKSGVGIVHRHPLPHRLAQIEYELAPGCFTRLVVRLKWCRFKGTAFYESGGQILRVLAEPVPVQGAASGVD